MKQITRQQEPLNIKIIENYFLLTALEGLASLIFALSLPKSEGNTWLLGYSPSRAAMIIILLLANAGLIWLTLNLRTKSDWKIKIQKALHKLVLNPNRVDLICTILSSWYITAIFILAVWMISKDVSYQAYLLRISPLFLFGTLIILQTLVVLLLQVKTKWPWLNSLLFATILVIVVGYPLIINNKLENLPVILAMLFATFYIQTVFRGIEEKPLNIKLGWGIACLSVCLFVLVAFTFIPKKFILYQKTFFIYAPLILTGMLVLTHGLSRLFSIVMSRMSTRIVAYLVVAIGMIIAGNFYYWSGMAHAEQINTTYQPNDDEFEYIKFAILAKQTNFQYTGIRNQMPLYPYIQAVFYNSNMSLEEFFVQGKQVNIVISLISLMVLFLIFQKFIPLYQSVILTLIAAFGLYVFKSGYFMVELLFYTISFCAYILLGFLLIKPSIKLSIVTGIVLGVGHLTKASILPALMLFIGVFTARELFFIYQRWRDGQGIVEKDSKTKIVTLTLVLGLYIAIISPYSIESKKIYGSYFYNVNTTFYMWYDSYEEALEGTIANGDALGWPNMPPEDIPSPGKYLREHTLHDIWERIQYGAHWQLENIRYQYGFFNYIIFFTIFVSVIFFIDVKNNLQVAKKYFPLILFSVLYFIAYIGLYIWYSPIANLPRFLYALYVPFLFSAFIAVKKFENEMSLPVIKLSNLTVFIMLIIDIWYIISWGPFNRDFGS